jgi:CHAT domain-containing protein
VKERLGDHAAAGLPVSLNNLCAVRTDRSELSAAVALCDRALTLRRRAVPIDVPAIADSLEHLALPLILSQRYAEAQRALDEAERLWRAMPLASPLALARTEYLLAVLRRYDGRYSAGSAAVQRVIETRQRVLAADHPELREAIQLRGELSFLQGNLASARADWSTALEMAEQTLRPGHPEIAQILRLLALCARAFGDGSGSRELIERALPIARSALAPCHQAVPDMLGDLAGIAGDEGDYRRSQSLTAEQLAAYERCLPRNDQRIATAVHNAGLLAAHMGDMERADRLQRRAIGLWSAGLGAIHPYVARGLDALADIAAARGHLTSARELYERALGIRRRSLGVDHPDVAWTLVNMGKVTASAGNVRLALQQTRRALDIYGRAGTGDDPDHVTRALVAQGHLQLLLSDPTAARASFESALAMRERIFGRSHPLAAEARADLALSEFAVGAAGDALTLALDAESAGRDHLRSTVRFLPERQALAYAVRRPRGLDLALSIVADRGRLETTAVFDAVIRSRGMILDELADRARAADVADPELATLNRSVTAARQRFANLLVRSMTNADSVPGGILDEARQQKEAAESALAERSAEASAELARARVGLEDVRHALPSDSALISFVRYERTTFRAGQATAPPHTAAAYFAFVVTSTNGEVTGVPLGTAASLESSISAWRGQADGASATGGLETAAAERAYRIEGAKLRRQLWDPLATRVVGASRIFIVPDGALNLVSFAALPAGQTRYLAETAPVLHMLSTERDLVPIESVATSHGLLAVGGPSYGQRSKGPIPQATYPPGCHTAGRLQFDDLPGSRAEVADVSRVWESASVEPRDVRVLQGRAASKGAVIGTAPGHRVLHLATHGFVVGNHCDSAPAHTRGVGGLATSSLGSRSMGNPLLVSGLAFAGANRDTSGTGNDNGILTAEEVVSMNLRGVEWAVLSACDTGLGEIRAGEGVFGLRRAFQIAGARTVIMSLWAVEDQSTRVWMRALYEGRFQRHLSTADSVRHASLEVLRQRRLKGGTGHPFFWAGFVAVGDWR